MLKKNLGSKNAFFSKPAKKKESVSDKLAKD